MTAPESIVDFDAFYRSESRRLLRFFGKRVGWEAAPDLVQDAFTRVLRSGPFERIENPRAYLTRTARNLLIERARRKMRDQTLIFPLDEGHDASVAPEQTWGIEVTDLRRAYRRALLTVPRQTRRIFLMHRLGHMTYQEIAQQVGIGESGVEYHMAQALARCRKGIADQPNRCFT